MDWLTSLFGSMGGGSPLDLTGTPPSLGASLSEPGQGPGLPGGWQGPPAGGPMEGPSPGDNVPLPTPGAPMSLAPPNPGGAPAAAPPAPATQQNPADRMAAMLRGIQAPARPDYQKVSTPHLEAPRHAPPAPQLMQILNAMGLGRAVVNPQPHLTLGQALGGR